MISDSQKLKHELEDFGCICRSRFTSGQSEEADDDHYTGHFRGSACNSCNLNFTSAKKNTPVTFHNPRGCDGHSIMKHIRRDCEFKNISAIPINTEQCISFDVDRFRFLHSLQFLQPSLDSLVENIKTDDCKNFRNVQNISRMTLTRLTY